MSTSAKVADIRKLLAGEPVFLAGSLVSEIAYGLSNAHSDMDLFVPNVQSLMTTGQILLDQGYTLDERFDRVWYRWKKWGVGKWETNSLRMHSPDGSVETNLIYKLVYRQPTNTLSAVLESFDFGCLAMGWDLQRDTYRDMRSYLFPGMDPDGPLPLVPEKRDDWRGGFFSQHNGLRELGRYAKYFKYGYDLSLVKDDLVTGYREQASYLSTHFDKDKQLLGQIYEVGGDLLENDMIDDLLQASKEIEYKDSLDVIMEAFV